MKKNSYYDKDKHKYMDYGTDHFSEFIFSLINHDAFSGYDTAIELGAGMGRFSSSIVKNFRNVTLVEPSEAYAEILNEQFSGKKTTVVNTTAEIFLANYEIDKPIIVFCFHIMHHLSYVQRKTIFQFLKKTDSKCIIIEPNHFNKFILLQIIFNSDMSFSEEKQYLSLTRRKYQKEALENNLIMSNFSRICFLPPFICNFLLRKISLKVIKILETLNEYLPFISSYQLITLEVSPRKNDINLTFGKGDQSLTFRH